MDFHEVTVSVSEQATKIIQRILAMNISTTEKRKQITKALQAIGVKYHQNIFNATSLVYGSTMSTAGIALQTQTAQLAVILVRNHALGRNITEYIQTYYDNLTDKAQSESFENAISMQRSPTLTRTIVGETCNWCVGLAGVHTNPTNDLFARHSSCDCRIEVSGYNTRNGLLKNYVKKGKA